MKIDVNRLLDLEYVNDVISQMNSSIDEIRHDFLDLYDLDLIQKMDVKSINDLFGQYNLDNRNVLQFLESDFIDSDWEFADLFADDILYSSAQKEQVKAKALDEIKSLNDAIAVINKNHQKSIDELEHVIKFLDSIKNVLSNNVVSQMDIKNLQDLLLNSLLSEKEKLNFSYEIVKYLIEKNKKLSLKHTKVEDTSLFEEMLDGVYALTELDENMSDAKIDEPSYSETIIGYYQYYKQLFKEIGLGESLSEVMNVGFELSKGLDSTIFSISKEDFCVELASLLYLLNGQQKNDKVDQTFVADLLMDLSRLDRIYEEDNKNKDYKFNALSEIKNELDIILMLDFDCLFSDRIRNRLSLLQIELNNNFITTKRKDEIELEFKKIKQDIKKLPEIGRQIKELNKLHNKINNMLSKSIPINIASEYYVMLTGLNAKVLELLELVSQRGIVADLSYQLLEIEKQISMNKINSNENKRVELKGFILFDFDENNQTYVVSDLDLNNKNNLIDKMLLHDKVNASFEDYNMLVHDLLVYGNLRILKDGSPYYIDRVLDNIYYNKDNRNHQTGMVRMRPLRNSMVRFISQKVLLHPNTEMYSQVVGIIQEVMPNVDIDINKEFSLYINFCSAIKKYETDSYDEAINRYLRKSPLYKLFLEKNDKTKLTSEECNLLRDIINMSMDAYSELEEKNERLKFDVINQIGVRKHRG